ncbi:MAG: hypothetical protein Sapg2KO_29490 [Saprospiraceae bacterium]
MKSFLLFSGLIVVLSLGLSYQVITLSQDYKAQKEVYASELNYRNRFLDPDEWLNQEQAKVKLERSAERLTGIAKTQKQVYSWALGFLGLLILYGAFIYWRFRQKRQYAILVLGCIIAALVCLPVGLGAPMLEIGAFERNLNLGEIPISARVMGFDVSVEVAQSFPGDIYFYYQSKSVLELIGLLFQQRNWVVGLSILLFSVLFPLMKIGLTLWLIARKHNFPQFQSEHLDSTNITSLTEQQASTSNSWLTFFVEKSGKWSMADVFVVAVFLAFLAFSNMQVGINTDSRVLVGLYFFLGYCLLSLISSTLVSKLKKDQPAKVAD